MPCRTTQDKRDMVKSSDKMWFTGGGNGKLPQYSSQKDTMNIMKRQKDMIPEDEHPGQKVSNTLLEKSRGQLLIDPGE